jgi:hypothetical protein
VDPIALGVHPAIDADAAAAGLGALPAYLPRAHDEALAAIVAEVRGGASRMVVLVGGSSTGKIQALWEAAYVADCPAGRLTSQSRQERCSACQPRLE